jgi:hypothetical protein
MKPWQMARWLLAVPITMALHTPAMSAGKDEAAFNTNAVIVYYDSSGNTTLDPYVDGPLLTRCLQCFDRIACVHMSGLLVRSHMSAGQDGFRDGGSRQNRDLVEGH